MFHTPGPWTIEYEDADGDMLENGVTIESCEGPVAFNVIDCSARLIAAAPELLKELKYLVEQFEEAVDWVPEYTAMADRAKAAIAKAEGRE
jgi:hypothetical protein